MPDNCRSSHDNPWIEEFFAANSVAQKIYFPIGSDPTCWRVDEKMLLPNFIFDLVVDLMYLISVAPCWRLKGDVVSVITGI